MGHIKCLCFAYEYVLVLPKGIFAKMILYELFVVAFYKLKLNFFFSFLLVTKEAVSLWIFLFISYKLSAQFKNEDDLISIGLQKMQKKL